MTTANIVMAICLIVLCGILLLLVIRYAKKNSEVDKKNREANEMQARIQDELTRITKKHAELRNLQREVEHIRRVTANVNLKPTATEGAKKSQVYREIGKEVLEMIPEKLQKTENGYFIEFFVATNECK